MSRNSQVRNHKAMAKAPYKKCGKRENEGGKLKKQGVLKDDSTLCRGKSIRGRPETWGGG